MYYKSKNIKENYQISDSNNKISILWIVLIILLSIILLGLLIKYLN